MVTKYEVGNLDPWVTKVKSRIEAVNRQSIQDTVDAAQLPTAKGGNMRIDTGFLRASGTASNSGMPSGPVRGDANVPNYYSPDSAAVEITIAKTDVGTPFFFGWTAAYARFREYKDGFLRLAAQKWPQTVKANIRKAKERFR